jgi:threonine aldolase
MLKYSFYDDYSEGAHPSILEALASTNLVQAEGYGEDRFCTEAKQMIRTHLENSDADIHFISGGTQSNLVVISSILKPYESVIAAVTGHIAVHEAGAIEATGHKINTIETDTGKLTPNDIKPVIDMHCDEHMVRPGLVFISDSTETGSIYTRKELEQLSEFCRNHDLFLYLDGARLGAAMASPHNDITLPQLSELVDVFYIGGTKNGALLGEAIVINNERLKQNFRFHLKQKGALLAKGRVMGIQFMELFRNNLFFEMGAHADFMALKMAKAIEESGYKFLNQPVSNQIFPVFPDKLIEKLGEKYGFHIWKKIDADNSAIRLVTSWATTEKAVDDFIDDLSGLS